MSKKISFLMGLACKDIQNWGSYLGGFIKYFESHTCSTLTYCKEKTNHIAITNQDFYFLYKDKLSSIPRDLIIDFVLDNKRARLKSFKDGITAINLKTQGISIITTNIVRQRKRLMFRNIITIYWRAYNKIHKTYDDRLVSFKFKRLEDACKGFNYLLEYVSLHNSSRDVDYMSQDSKKVSSKNTNTSKEKANKLISNDTAVLEKQTSVTQHNSTSFNKKTEEKSMRTEKEIIAFIDAYRPRLTQDGDFDRMLNWFLKYRSKRNRTELSLEEDAFMTTAYNERNLPKITMDKHTLSSTIDKICGILPSEDEVVMYLDNWKKNNLQSKEDSYKLPWEYHITSISSEWFNNNMKLFYFLLDDESLPLSFPQFDICLEIVNLWRKKNLKSNNHQFNAGVEKFIISIVSNLKSTILLCHLDKYSLKYSQVYFGLSGL